MASAPVKRRGELGSAYSVLMYTFSSKEICNPISSCICNQTAVVRLVARRLVATPQRRRPSPVARDRSISGQTTRALRRSYLAKPIKMPVALRTFQITIRLANHS